MNTHLLFGRKAVLRMRGFTVIEMMIAVVIVGILAAIAVPSFRTMNLTTKRSSAVNELVAALQYARGESIKRSIRVTVCPGAIACGTNWATGWMVFANQGAEATGQDVVIDGDDVILKTYSAVPAQITVTANTGSFVYRPFNTRMAGGTVTVCTPLGATQARAVIVSPTGRARSSAVNASNGPLTCP